MTEKEYEGTPELIFYCEYNPHDFEDRLEIPFTNNHDIQIDFTYKKYKKLCVTLYLKSKKHDLSKNFFGQNILNINAIAGKNGIGKTNIFKKIFSLRSVVQNEILLLYRLSKNEVIIETSALENASFIIDTDNGSLISNKSYFYNQTFTKSNVDLLLLDADSNITIDSKYAHFRRSKVSTSYAHLYNCLTQHPRFRKVFNISNQRMTIELARIDNLTLFNEYRKLIESLLNSYSDENEAIKKQFLYLLYVCEIVFGVANQQIFNFYINKGIYIKKEALQRTILTLKALLKMPLRLNILIRNIKELLFSLDDAFVDQPYGKKVSKPLSVFIKELFRIFDDLPESCITLSRNKFQIIIQANYWDISIFRFIEKMQYFHSEAFEASYINYDFGSYSSGEKEILMHSSALLSSMLSNKITHKNHTTVIFIDEYEQHLHPEWMRKYLFFLVKLFTEEDKTSVRKVQFIINTHSPYLISDLPKENIILLEKDEKTGKRTARKSNYGFASNYYDIMSDSFFLDDTIGEFAKQKINQVIKLLNSLSNLLDKKELRSKKISNKFMQRSQLIFDHVKPIIQLIGDPFIKQQLDRMVMSIQERLKVSCQPESKRELLEKQRAILEAQIKQIDQELGNDKAGS